MNPERYSVPLDKWVGHYQKQKALPWKLQVMTLDGHGHVSSIPAAFRQGMHWVLSE